MIVVSIVVICVMRVRNSKKMQVIPFHSGSFRASVKTSVIDSETDINTSSANLMDFDRRETQVKERESEYKSMKFSINPDLDRTYSTVSLLSNNE